ncbi:MAG: VOC family protein [Gammaproteobacteria bacterium]|nr:VOC family protein [Gammaproteobacteria bacterium]
MDKVQHFEIPADDVARARKFYEGVFGWKTMEFPMPGMLYVGLHTGPVDEKNMWKEAGFINGGMFQRSPQFPVQGPVVAITVEDIDASLAQVKAAGGTVVMEKMEIADMGLYAYIKDTEGNIIGVWQNLQPMA